MSAEKKTKEFMHEMKSFGQQIKDLMNDAYMSGAQSVVDTLTDVANSHGDAVAMAALREWKARGVKDVLK